MKEIGFNQKFQLVATLKKRPLSRPCTRMFRINLKAILVRTYLPKSDDLKHLLLRIQKLHKTMSSIMKISRTT
jgi:hypothetical protein